MPEMQLPFWGINGDIMGLGFFFSSEVSPFLLEVSLFIIYMGVSKNSGTPKSSILIGFSIINHPFWGKHPYFWKHPK